MALTDKISAVADAIRNKTGKTDAMTLDEMAVEVANIQTGITPIGTLTITENGTHDVSSYASAEVNVAGSSGGGNVETCTVTICDNVDSRNIHYHTIENNATVMKSIITNGDYQTIDVIKGSGVFFRLSNMESAQFEGGEPPYVCLDTYSVKDGIVYYQYTLAAFIINNANILEIW